jgi:3'-5' exoribonuclease
VNGERAAYSPREWIGDAPFPWPPALGIPDGDPVLACFSVNSVTVGRTRTGSPFLKLQLADAHGVVEARMWDDVDVVADHIRQGSYIGVRGCMESYQDQRQLRIEELAILSIALDDLVLFLPRSARPAERMEAELAALVASVSDLQLRSLLELLLGAGTETGHAFRLAPAAKQNHHAYLGGLLEHTLSVATLCDLLASHYGGSIDRDLLLTGALLHDIGKIREIGARGGFPYTDEGKLLGHILLGLQMTADAAATIPGMAPQRLLLLQHLIASHQGRYEWQSPREPRILEAIILHYADDLDAKLNQAGSLLDAVHAGWSAYDRSFARDFLKHRDTAAAPVAQAAPAAGMPVSGPRAAARHETGNQPRPGHAVEAAAGEGGAIDGAAGGTAGETAQVESLDLFE